MDRGPTHSNYYIKTSWEQETPKLQQIYTHKRKSNANTKIKMVIKPQKIRTKEEEKKKDQQKQIQNIKQMAIRKYISIITLNINVLNAPNRRHRLVAWI